MDPTNRNTALCSAFVDELARSGVGHVMICPGSRSAPLAVAFWNEPRIKVWSIVDERSAGFFALGLLQGQTELAVVLTTSGTAAANLHPAVAEARESSLPLIVLTADRPPELRDRGSGQTIDQIKLYGSSVRWFWEFGNVEADDDGLLYARSTACRAVAEALVPAGGPVHINVALREPLAPVDAAEQVTATSELAREGRPAGKPLTTSRQPFVAPPQPLVEQLAALVRERPRGLIVAGRQIDGALPEAVAALARASGYPVLAEPTSQLRAGSDSGEHTIASYDAIFRSLPDALAPEQIIRVGDMVTSKALRIWLTENQGCRQIVLQTHDRWNDPSSHAEIIRRVHVPSLCRQLAIELADGAVDEQWRNSWIAAAGRAEGAIDEFLQKLGDELFEPAVHRRLADLVPDPALLYVASSMPVRDLETFFPSSSKQIRFLANRGANGIDGTISSGLGAAAAGGHVFIVLGDVALYHDMNGLLAMKRNGVEATVLVMNNGGGAIFDFLPIAESHGIDEGYEQLFGTPTGLDLAKVADLYGLDFTRISSYGELAHALSKPGLVEVPLDRARNVELHRKLFESVAAALA